MWIMDKTGKQLESVVCDICGELGGIRVQVANIIIAEVCEGKCTKTVIDTVKGLCKTKAGPPDVKTNKGPIPVKAG